MTDISVLKDLDLKIGDELTLLELDNRVEVFINNEEILTPLSSTTAEEILSDGEYIFYIEEGNDLYYKINFEIVNNTDDESTIIRIVN